MPREPGRPVRARDPRRQGHRAAGRRLPLAPDADAWARRGRSSLDGAIFFFEDYKSAPYYVDGQLTQLAHAGKLDEVAGVVVGELEGCDWGDLRPASDWARSRSIEDVLEEHLEPLGVPVLYRLPLGHGKHLASIPLGVRYTLDADARTLTVDESPYRA